MLRFVNELWSFICDFEVCFDFELVCILFIFLFLKFLLLGLLWWLRFWLSLWVYCGFVLFLELFGRVCEWGFFVDICLVGCDFVLLEVEGGLVCCWFWLGFCDIVLCLCCGFGLCDIECCFGLVVFVFVVEWWVGFGVFDNDG